MCERKYHPVFAVKYVHQYVYGRQLILRTDHKPLVSIFGENKGIQTLAFNVMLYFYQVTYIKPNLLKVWVTLT